MIDTHCHVDLYPDPSRIAVEARSAGVATIVVTNLPSAFSRAYPYVGNADGFRLALGLHPLMAESHQEERELFTQFCSWTDYIGEVGLDFSPEGYRTRDLQVESFRFVLRALGVTPKFMTLHSRRAEAEVLAMVRDALVYPVVFHWFSGPASVADAAIAEGHYFSVNPAMTRSSHGQKLIARIPRERVLTESDGPFVKVGARPAVPSDVALVEKHLADEWHVTPVEARASVRANFRSLKAALGGLRGSETDRRWP